MKTLMKILLGAILLTVASFALPDERVQPVLVRLPVRPTITLPPRPEAYVEHDDYVGWTFFYGQTSAYDPFFNYQYKRAIYLWVGPPEKADGYPEPAPQQLRDVILNLTIHSVNPGEVCLPEAVVINEYGGEFFPGCPHGVENEPIPTP